jgi:hypothetical protein
VSKLVEFPGSMLRVSTPRLRIPRTAQEPLGGLGAEAGEVQGAGRVGAAVGVGVADLGPPAGVHEHGGVAGDPAVAALEGADVLHGHHRVRVPGRPGRDVDDHRRDDQLRQVQLGRQPPARGEVPGGVDMGPDVLDDAPLLHVVAVILDRHDRPPLRLLARREGREGRRQRVGEVDQAVSPAREGRRPPSRLGGPAKGGRGGDGHAPNQGGPTRDAGTRPRRLEALLGAHRPAPFIDPDIGGYFTIKGQERNQSHKLGASGCNLRRCAD